jgi:hypothetical protein
VNCPICGALAENISRPDFDGLGVRCHNCGDFEVAGTVLNHLLRMDVEGRTAALEKAKRITKAGVGPAINSFSLS